MKRLLYIQFLVCEYLFLNRVFYIRYYKFQLRCIDLGESLLFMYMDILRDILRDVDWNRCIFGSVDYKGVIMG